MTTIIDSVLFDLDGTLLDTAPDLVFALNQLRKEQGLDDLPLSAVRSLVSLGSRPLIKLALGLQALSDNDPYITQKRERFLTLYQEHIANSTRFFPEIETVLNFLDEKKIPWGIVTNKLTVHTLHLLNILKFRDRPGCVICGDTLATYKPSPEPILHGCQLLKRNPKTCLYVGDSVTDVTASKAAGTKSLVALYGYIGVDDNPYGWNADGYIQQPIEMIDWLLTYQLNESN